VRVLPQRDQDDASGGSRCSVIQRTYVVAKLGLGVVDKAAGVRVGAIERLALRKRDGRRRGEMPPESLNDGADDGLPNSGRRSVRHDHDVPVAARRRRIADDAVHHNSRAGDAVRERISNMMRRGTPSRKKRQERTAKLPPLHDQMINDASTRRKAGSGTYRARKP
jgi:hypothetical protein